MYSVSRFSHINKFMLMLRFIIYHNVRMNPFMPTQDLNKISKNFCITSAATLKGTNECNMHNYFPVIAVRDLVVGPLFAFDTSFSSLIVSHVIAPSVLHQTILHLQVSVIFSSAIRILQTASRNVSLGLLVGWVVPILYVIKHMRLLGVQQLQFRYLGSHSKCWVNICLFFVL